MTDNDDYNMKIERIDSKKHDIKQRALMEAGIIPCHPSISIFSGSQGGGKSTLVANLLTKPHMYGKSYELVKTTKKHVTPKPYFDAIFLFIGSDDDMYDQLIAEGTIRPEHVKHMPTSADIQMVIDTQKKLMADANGDITKVPKILCIFDDIINDRRLISSKPFLELFVKGRHINSSTWLLCQYLNLCPKACRLQANYLFVFKCNRAEMVVLSDQFCPPDMKKDEFHRMVLDTTKDTDDSKNNFLLIVKRAPIDKRFRQNLDTYIVIKRSNIDDGMDDTLAGIKKRLKAQTKKRASSDDEEVVSMPKTKEPHHSMPVFDPSMSTLSSVQPDDPKTQPRLRFGGRR
jgi:hypothetical protein